MQEPDRLIPGKLPGHLLNRLLRTYVRSDPSVLIGPEIGADAAAIEIQSPILIVKSDPITFPTPDAARYLVHVNANDIVCMGGTPRWLVVTALLPASDTTEDSVEDLFRQLSTASAELGISLVGGHTEITEAVTRPVLVGMLLGEASGDTLLDLRRSRPGDSLLLCNTVAVEGTAILANEVPPESLTGVPDRLLERARNLTDDPGISVLPAARALLASGAPVRGLHDPTEGGIATAIWEVARITGCDIDISRSIPVRDDTRLICERLGLDPLGLIASGALLAVVERKSATAAIAGMTDHGITALEIGRLSASEGPDPVVRLTDRSLLPVFKTDEIARFFSNL